MAGKAVALDLREVFSRPSDAIVLRGQEAQDLLKLCAMRTDDPFQCELYTRWARYPNLIVIGTQRPEGGRAWTAALDAPKD